MHNANEVFMIKRLQQSKAAMRETLNYIQESDDTHEMLFKYQHQVYHTYRAVEFLNQKLLEEMRSEDEASAQMISTQKITSLQAQMNQLYQSAELMKKDLFGVMAEV